MLDKTTKVYQSGRTTIRNSSQPYNGGSSCPRGPALFLDGSLRRGFSVPNGNKEPEPLERRVKSPCYFSILPPYPVLGDGSLRRLTYGTQAKMLSVLSVCSEAHTPDVDVHEVSTTIVTDSSDTGAGPHP